MQEKIKKEENRTVTEKGTKDEMISGIIEIDVHGMNVEEAVKAVAKQVHCAGSSVYRIRVIHGYHGGTRIQRGLREEFSYGRESKVRRIEMGQNEGITELILREF
ncbi:MAG: Smr/MutS family protein [Lachnospiraceae bacterium]|nr:Smr/MutS family protein [Robinsoniella sp.]MDY3765839.1 Smr/MutS family protein [Lachnospiraceae bacterium]